MVKLRITDKIYALDSTKGNYAYIIQDKDIYLIDTGRPGQGKSILKELKSINIETNDINHILITHHDVDHVGNIALLEEVTGATLWAPKEDIPYINGDKPRPGIKRLFSWFIRTKKPEKINPYPPKEKIDEIQIIPTPGHTPGHVCLLYDDVLFAGDLIRTSKDGIKPLASFMNWDQSLLDDSIKKINSYSFKWICPAHGLPIRVENGI